MNAVKLAPNQLHRFYRGGEAIARFRGVALHDEYAPEDWIGSTTTIHGENGQGLSALPDGRLVSAGGYDGRVVFWRLTVPKAP